MNKKGMSRTTFLFVVVEMTTPCSTTAPWAELRGLVMKRMGAVADYFDKNPSPLHNHSFHFISQATHCLESEVGVMFRDVVLTLLMGLDCCGESKKEFYWDVVAQLESKLTRPELSNMT